MKNRPFEVGDLVTTPSVFGLSEILEVKENGLIYTDSGRFYYDEVGYIRKPRPGNPESRAIVADIAFSKLIFFSDIRKIR